MPDWLSFEDYHELEALMKQKKLKPFIEDKFPLENSSEAFDKTKFSAPATIAMNYYKQLMLSKDASSQL
jgi:hypothetical protein